MRDVQRKREIFREKRDIQSEREIFREKVEQAEKSMRNVPFMS